MVQRVNGSRMRTSLITWPSLRSSVHNTSHPYSVAACSALMKLVACLRSSAAPSDRADFMAARARFRAAE